MHLLLWDLTGARMRGLQGPETVSAENETLLHPSRSKARTEVSQFWMCERNIVCIFSDVHVKVY